MPVPEQAERPGFPELLAALEGGERALATFLEDVHTADIAEWMQDLDPAQIWRIWGLRTPEERAELLQVAGERLRDYLMSRLSAGQITDLVEKLPTDEVVDLLALTDEHTTEQVLRQVDFERAEGLRELLHYPDDTAGGLMTKDFVWVRAGTRVGDAIKEIKSEEGPAGEEEGGLFVVDEDERPVGYISDRSLLTSGIHTLVDDAMGADVVTVGVRDDQEEVAHIFQKYDLMALAVVDAEGRIQGVITADDARDVLEEEIEEDLRRLVGTSTVEQTRLPVLTRVRQRLPLMGLTVIGGIATAQILDWAIRTIYGGASSQDVDLLRYVPIIVGLAGNVGIQSSTILVRGFATGEIPPERELSVVAGEVGVGMLVGLICGLTTAVVSAFLEADGSPAWAFGAALGVAIVVAVAWAAVLGCSVPLVCRRIGIDPAVVAGPFLIALSDISGATIFVAVAYLVLQLSGG
jgi:magnesium transporter